MAQSLSFSLHHLLRDPQCRPRSAAAHPCPIHTAGVSTERHPRFTVCRYPLSPEACWTIDPASTAPGSIHEPFTAIADDQSGSIDGRASNFVPPYPSGVSMLFPGSLLNIHHSGALQRHSSRSNFITLVDQKKDEDRKAAIDSSGSSVETGASDDRHASTSPSLYASNQEPSWPVAPRGKS